MAHRQRPGADKTFPAIAQAQSFYPASDRIGPVKNPDRLVSFGCGLEQCGCCMVLVDGNLTPAGRRAEDGIIPDCYCLQETPGRNYQQRTKRNVRDSTRQATRDGS